MVHREELFYEKILLECLLILYEFSNSFEILFPSKHFHASSFMPSGVNAVRLLDQWNEEALAKVNNLYSRIEGRKSNVKGSPSESSAALRLICSPRFVYKGS